MAFNPNQFYLPPGGMPSPVMMPQQAYPGAPGQPQSNFNLAALQQQAQMQFPQRNGTPQQAPQGFSGIPGMPQPFMGGAPPGMMPLPAQQQQPAGQVNMAAVEQLLRSGQLTQEQFATLAAQIRNHQQAQKHAQQQMANAMGGVPAQPPPQPVMPVPAPPPQQLAPPAGGDRIPLQLLQQYSTQLAQVRSLQQKAAMLQNALQTGIVGGQAGPDGQIQGQTRLSPQQRPLVEKQLDETKRQVGAMLQAIQAFQNQWTPQRIQADFQFYQAQRTGQQPPQPVPPPNPAAAAQNLYSSPQQQHAALTAQMLQRQAQAQAAAIAAAAGKSTPGPPAPQQLQPAPAPQPNFQSQPQPISQPQPQPQPQPLGQMMPPTAMPPLHLLQTQLNPQLFMKSLFEVMRKRGEPIDTTPYVDGKEVDLYQLYQAVMIHGGSQQVNQQGTWHRIAAQLGYPADTSAQALRDAPPDTQRVSLELARLYQKMLRPFEEIWGRLLVRQQQSILEAQRSGQSLPGAPPAQALAPAPAPAQPPRPPSQNAAARPGMQGPSATQLEASRQQLLQQAKAASLAAQQVGAGAPTLAAKQQNGAAQQGAPTAKVNSEPTLEQIAEAKNMVQMIKQSIEATRPKLKLLEVAEDQKQAVAHLTHELIPQVRKVMDTLPLFLAMTGDANAVRKMLTFAAIFQDQMRYMASQQFALDLSGLTQLREQFQRCWNFMKQNPLGRATGAAQPAQGPSTSPQLKPEQFGTVAQGRGLRVEDLKPPPVKHRRTASSVAGASPATAPSPSTPQMTAGSPPQTGATPSAKPAKAKRGVKKEVGLAGSSPAAGASPAATLAALRSDLIKDSPSPMNIVVPPGPVPVAEEPPSLKRKREEEDIDRDPGAFIEKTLRLIDQPAFTPVDFGLAGVGGPTATGLSLDVDPAIPPVVSDTSSAPLSFTVLSSAAPLAVSLSAIDSTAHAPIEQPFDFDFYIDSSAAGFDSPQHGDASTPEFVGGGGSNSAPTPATPGDALAATPKGGNAALARSPAKQAPSPLVTGVADVDGLEDAFYSAGGVVVAEVDAWLNGGATAIGSKLPGAFSWEGADTPAITSSWNFYSDF